MLYTDKLEETIRFYSSKLGFILDERSDDWGWAMMHLDEVEIMFAKPNAHTPFKTAQFTGSFYISTDNVQAWWDKLKNQVAISYELETFEWGMREFAIYDNNGYLLQFGQEIEAE